MKEKVEKLAVKYGELKDRENSLSSDIKYLKSKLADAEKEEKQIVSEMKDHGVTPKNIDSKIEDLFKEAGVEIMNFSKELEKAESQVDTIKEELEK